MFRYGFRRFSNQRPTFARPQASQPVGAFERLEDRYALNAAFDIIGLSALRNDPLFADIDGTGIGVAVIDSGIRGDHATLSRNLSRGTFVDTVTPNNTTPKDPVGHGSHVAGTAAGQDPNIGVATDATLVAIRGLGGPDEQIPQNRDPVSDGLLWVSQNHQRFNIKVVNMSLGFHGVNFGSEDAVPFSQAPQLARQRELILQLEREGITVVTASGNDYVSPQFPSKEIVTGASAPAIYSTISVANTWPDDGTESQTFARGQALVLGGEFGFVSFERDAAPDRLNVSSQRSTQPNQLAAPGSQILSVDAQTTNGFVRFTGTSMASPMVAGVVALVQEAAQRFGGRYLTPDEVVATLKTTADQITDSNVASNGRLPIRSTNGQVEAAGPAEPVPETGLTFSRVNVYRAVQSIRERFTTGTGGGGGGGGGQTVTGNNNRISDAVDTGLLSGNEGFFDRIDGSTLDNRLVFPGRIGIDGQFNTGNQDVDLFKLNIQARGDLRLTTFARPGGQDFDSFLRLFDQNGVEINSNDDISSSNTYSDIFVPQIAPGTYYVGVSSFNNTNYNANTGANATNGESQGDYQLVVELKNPDNNGVLTGAVPFQGLPSAFPGFIGADEGVLVGQQDVDFFSVAAPDDGFLIVDVTTQPGAVNQVDSSIRVFRSTTVGSILPIEEIASNDDDPTWTPERGGRDLDSFVRVAVNSGDRLFVGVSDFGNLNFNPVNPYDRSAAGPGGFYDLFLGFDNGDVNGTISSAAAVAIGANLNGVIGADFGNQVGRAGTKDVDFFTFTPDTDGILDLNITSPDSSLLPYLSVWTFDPFSFEAIKIADTLDSTGERLAFLADAGVPYYVAVTGRGNEDFQWFAPASGAGGDTGTYQLSSILRQLSDLATLANDVAGSATAYTIDGGPILQEIGQDGFLSLGGVDVDFFTLTAPRTATYRVLAQVADNEVDANLNPVLRVFDQNNVELGSNDNIANDTRDAMVSMNLTAGQTVRVGVSGFAGYSPTSLTGRLGAGVGAYMFSVASADIASAFVGFTDTADTLGAGRTRADTDASQVVFLNTQPGAGIQPSIRVVDPLDGAILSDLFVADFSAWTGPTDISLVGDVDGDGVVELIQFNRPTTSGSATVGDAIRIVRLRDGAITKTIPYGPAGVDLSGMVDPEDGVFLGHFTQKTRLEALFFNRTNQNSGATSLIVVDLATGAVTDRGVHNGVNFNGWIDPTDEYTVSDTNFDGLDDLVIVNRVANPEAFRSTPIGFVGMVSLAPNFGGRAGANIGFYRFFDWNFAKPGEASVFPGYDELQDNATFGRVTNNGANTPVIVLINSQFDGNAQAAGFALLQPAPLVQGVRDSFQLISTQFRNVLPSAGFDSDDTYAMTDVTGDGADEFVSFSRGSGDFALRSFGAFNGQVIGLVKANSQALRSVVVRSDTLSDKRDAEARSAIGPVATTAADVPVASTHSAESASAECVLLADAVDSAMVLGARRHLANRTAEAGLIFEFETD